MTYVVCPKLQCAQIFLISQAQSGQRIYVSEVFHNNLTILVMIRGEHIKRYIKRIRNTKHE